MKRAVVTGASSGIGAATVRLLREHGWNVVGVARRADRLEQLAAETGAEVFVADLTKQADVDALRDHLAATGGVSTLVNNAGGAMGLDSVEAADPADWQGMFDVNVLAVQRVTAALLPLLRASVEPGGSADIMTVSSIAGHIAYEGGGGYNAAKFAVHAMLEVLRLELSGEPIRVLEIAPGMVKTEEFSLNRFKGDQARADKVYDNVPDPLSAEDVARTIVATLELPPHVSLDLVVIKPVAQSAAYKVARGPLRVKRADGVSA
ncbi:SDR family oxidoreductase [Herbiconiux sp. UC225_62]|uniref:SDR family oxidoreductase n=1 Tax=Herbiconiux sp. UC225_62 TaxID=3350168 RepID=UPI0036D372F4